MWADRFEEDVADLFKLQDQVVARLANSLGYELVKAEAKKLASSKHPDAADLELKGRALFLTRFQQGANEKEITHQAQALFEQALAIDPDNSDALAGSAFTYYIDYYYGLRPDIVDYDAKILAPADRAISLDPSNVQAYFVKGMYLVGTHRTQDGLRAVNEGLAIDPNYAPLYNTRAWALGLLGKYEEAKSDLLKLMQLSPRDPAMGMSRTILAGAQMGLGQYEEAINQVQLAIDSGYRSSYPYSTLAAAYALSGKNDEAKAALAEALKFSPDLTVKAVQQNNVFPIAIEGLRKAGLKEQ